MFIPLLCTNKQQQNNMKTFKDLFYIKGQPLLTWWEVKQLVKYAFYFGIFWGYLYLITNLETILF